MLLYMVASVFLGDVGVICVGKYMICAQRKKLNGSTSLENNNMCYVSFKIWE